MIQNMSETDSYMKVVSFVKNYGSFLSKQTVNASKTYRITNEKSCSFLYRDFLLLNTLILSKSTTIEALIPFFNPISIDDTSALQHLIYKALTKFEKGIITINSEEYSQLVVSKKNGYVANFSTYELTFSGLSYLKALNNALEFPDKILHLPNEVYDALYDAHRDKHLNDHALFEQIIFNEFVAKIPMGKVIEFGLEINRTDSYEIVDGLRNTQQFVADCSFLIANNPLFITPFFMEADRETERANKIADKCLRVLRFNERQTNVMHQFPCTTAFVTSGTIPKPTVTTPKQKKKTAFTKESAKQCLILINSIFQLLYPYNKVEMPTPIWEEDLQNGSLLVDEITEYVIACCENAPTEFHWRKGLVNTLTSFLQTVKDYQEDHYPWVTLNGYSKFLNWIDDPEEPEPLPGRFPGYAYNRRQNLAVQLDADESAKQAFRNGQSIYFLRKEEMPFVIKSMLPSLAGRENIKAVLQALGLSTNIKKFWSSIPLERTDRGHYINMRNTVLTDGILVSFEDISYDISARERLKEYVSLPSDYTENVMLCVIINDDLTTANGLPLSKVQYWDSYVREYGKSFEEAFAEAYGGDGVLPYKYKSTKDFCFIRRSEYLSALSGNIHPFIQLGSKCFLKRTTEGMDSDQRKFKFLEGQLHIGHRIPNPENFVHY